GEDRDGESPDMNHSHKEEMTMAKSKNPRVAIVGAGFGGLNAAKALSKAPVEITLIDRNNYHLFQPLLYQVATAGLEPDEIVHPVRDLFRRRRNVFFQLGKIKEIHKDDRLLVLEEGPPLSYDYLILAGGAVTNYFGVPGAEEFSLPMKTIPSALHVRNHVLRQFEKCERDQDGVGEGAMNFVIVGGGPTGVELAGQLSELFNKVLHDDFRRIDTSQARVILIEATPHLLGSFDENLAEYTRKALEKRGVEVLTGATVASVESNAVYLKGGERIPTQTLIWAAGITANPLVDVVGTPKHRGGRLVVEPDLSLPDYPEIFVVGDMAGAEDQEGQMYPQLATVAIQQGRHAARQAVNRIAGRPTVPFVYRDPGTMATIGRSDAIAQLAGGLKFKGFVAWLMWVTLHIAKLVGFRNQIDVLFNWIYNYLTYDFNSRIILDIVPADEQDMNHPIRNASEDSRTGTILAASEDRPQSTSTVLVQDG
ncbi:MAG TPA: NAD(P)/FAD-dependent oxidoreductase, partial [Rhodothermales bacterium]|nr:NAD(P)/FAD-dependent oxidoreductase [Rhodothermales bacterium]